MENPREVSEEFIRGEAFTESDAIHPRFAEDNAEEIREYELKHYFYCKQCNLFFAPTVHGLNNHFRGNMVKHKAIGSCFYCQGKVYEYSLNNEPKVYHNCRDKDKDC